MASQPPIKSVALLGADGKLGPAVLTQLLAASFTVTVLKRQGSSQPDNYPAGVKVSRVPDDMEVEKVTEVLKGQDALVVTIKGSQTEVQERLARACVQAGVRRMVPADFGSVDSASEWTQELVPLYKHKTALRERLIEMTERPGNENFSWTSLVCGHFFDWDPYFLHIYPQKRRTDILDDGNTKWSASTLSQIGKATAGILKNPVQTKNRIVYCQSFLISQNETVAALEKASGEKWSIVRHESKAYEREEKAKADGGDLEAVENLVWMLGALDADWTKKEGFAMEILGLEEESLEKVVGRMVEEWKSEGKM